ncbi:Hypothetical protein EHI5A_126050 [Entamoeba histolytica KU27]|uniref:Uncharacterized protein n=1 Tax=Entamoeba histolytica KU27 TaxID=885311 RepID=M2SCK6_ENTHI|nr:Hypothetical protein EHI5A_126050 [Entamoeba histolytica KU27]
MIGFVLFIVFTSATDTVLCMEQGISDVNKCNNILVTSHKLINNIDKTQCIEYRKGKSLKVYNQDKKGDNKKEYHIKYYKDGDCKEVEESTNGKVTLLDETILRNANTIHNYGNTYKDGIEVKINKLYSGITKRMYNIYNVQLKGEAPEGTPEGTPEKTPEKTPEGTPEKTPEKTPEGTLDNKDDMNTPSNLNASSSTFITLLLGMLFILF